MSISQVRLSIKQSLAVFWAGIVFGPLLGVMVYSILRYVTVLWLGVFGTYIEPGSGFYEFINAISTVIGIAAGALGTIIPMVFSFILSKHMQD